MDIADRGDDDEVGYSNMLVATAISDSSSAVTGYETSIKTFGTQASAATYAVTTGETMHIRKTFAASTTLYLLFNPNGLTTGGALRVAEAQVHFLRAVCAYL